MADAQANGGERVRLREGSEVLVRPIEPDDKEALERGLEGLSRASRYARFFQPVTRFSGSQLRYLTEVDHRDHEALVAFPSTGDRAVDATPVGVARYVKEQQEGPEGGAAAEVAVVVADAWHGRGLATELLERLVARARENGFQWFVAYALADNDDVIGVLGRLGRLEVIEREGQIVTTRVELPGEMDDTSPLRRLLRAAAEGVAEDLPLSSLFRTLTKGGS
jgi:RimJ/RimL family protein N-acetyltransferase